MARRQRFHSPTATYHAMLRGNNGQDIFFSDDDRTRMCLLLQQSSERFGHQIEAFCLMSNHIHLAVKISDTSISKFMHYLAFRYARYINRKYKRIGHLFQGRFKSVLVDDETYLKELIRYIHLNPVRANIVSDPLNYPWSSHKAYLNKDEIVWLSNSRVLNRFHHEKEHAMANFNKFVLNGIGIETEYDFKSGLVNGVVGSREFANVVVKRYEKKEIELTDFISYVCNLFDLKTEEFKSQGRSEKLSRSRAFAALLIRETNILSLEQLGNHLGKDPSGLTKLANRLQMKCHHDPLIAKQIQDAHKWIQKMSGCQA